MLTAEPTCDEGFSLRSLRTPALFREYRLPALRPERCVSARSHARRIARRCSVQSGRLAVAVAVRAGTGLSPLPQLQRRGDLQLVRPPRRRTVVRILPPHPHGPRSVAAWREERLVPA